VTTDFRSVLAAVCERHLRLADEQLVSVFPQMPAFSAGLDGLIRARASAAA
jgi:hypothetical protein